MNRQQVLQKIEKTWEELKTSYDGLTESQMNERTVTDLWSVKDILAHVTTWDEECLKYLPVILEGGRPPRYITYGGIDAFNAQTTEKKRHLSLSEVLEQLDHVHSRLIEYIATIPEEQFAHETRVRRRIRYDTYGHYPEHANMIREWRETSDNP